jgi:helicase
MLRVLVSTPTLAWGVNVPARRVAVLGIHRGMSNRVSPLDVIQMTGRAGRTGLDERGDAYVFLPRDTFEDDKREYSTAPNIYSHLGKEDVLVFHVIAEMETGRARTPERLVAWHARTFAAAQGKALTLDTATAVFDLLERCHAIEQFGDYWRPTALGRISSWLYFDPRNVWAWAMGFRRIDERGWWDQDAAVADVLGGVPIGTLGYVSLDMQEDVADFMAALRYVDPTRETYALGAVQAWAYWRALQPDTDDNKADKGAGGVHVRTARADVERVVSACKLIDGMWGRWNRKAEWDALTLRVKYGIGRELVPLVALPDVGPVRARRLWAAGFGSLEAVAGGAARLTALVQAVGSRPVALRIVQAAQAFAAGGPHAVQPRTTDNTVGDAEAQVNGGSNTAE